LLLFIDPISLPFALELAPHARFELLAGQALALFGSSFEPTLMGPLTGARAALLFASRAGPFNGENAGHFYPPKART
jgi:hypothetical protein